MYSDMIILFHFLSFYISLSCTDFDYFPFCPSMKCFLQWCLKVDVEFSTTLFDLSLKHGGGSITV